MKKQIIYYLLLVLFAVSWQSKAQSLCTQTFSGSGYDDDPTVVTVNATDISCNVGQPINSITITNSSGSLGSAFCGSWYDFTLNVDGVDVITGCAADIDGYDVTGFTTLTVTSNDLDAYSDSVNISFDLEVNYVTPACAPPSNLTASNITNSQAELSWTENGNATVYNIEIGPAGFAPTGNPTNSGVANPFTVTGLNSATSYDYYVQADCGASGGTGTSAWVGPYTFTTNPACGDTFYDDGGPNGDYSPNLNQSFTIYPTNAGDVVTVTFNSFHMENGWDGMMVYNGPDTNAPIFDSGSTYNRTACPNGAWTGGTGDTYTADGQSFTSTDASGALTFVFMSDGSYQYAGWEAVVSCGPPPACPDPSSLSVSFTSSTDANLAWTENGSATTWNIEYGPSGFTQGQGTMVNGVTTNPYTVSGLTPRTDYDFYVQADCGASGGSGTSNWVGPFTWTQPDNGDDCAVPIMGTVVQDCNQATPLTLDFANAISEYLSSCDGLGNYGYWIKITWPASGTLIVNNTGSSVGLTILDACGGNELYCNNNSLGASTSLQAQSLIGSDVWMYFWKDNQSGTADICLQEETCPFPTNLAANNVTSTSADLSWTENGSATTWNIEYGPAGFAQGSGTVVSGVTANPYTLTGLSQGTDYEFYVQSDCGGGDTSSWFGPGSFTTTCGILIPDYLQDFTSFLPGCWDENTGPVSGPTGTSGSSSWTSDGFANNGSSGSARVNLYSNTHEEWLLTPHFDLSGGSYELNFDVAVTTYSGTSASAMGSDDQVQLLISTDGGNTWSNLMTWDVNNTPSNTGDNVSVDLSGYNQTDVQFAFWASDGSVNDSEDYNFYVDNFAVRTPPSCPNPSQGYTDNILSHSARLNWTPGGNETAWNIEYGPAGFTQGSGTVVNVSANPYTLSGLMSGTDYEWYVQSDCGNGDTSNWVGPYAFSTPPACGDTFYDDGGPNNNYSSNLNQSFTIYPDNAGDVVSVTFNSFDMEQGWDGMMVYNGPDTNAPLIDSGSTYGRTTCPNGAWTGGPGDTYSANGLTFTSTDPSGALTFVFMSDGSFQYAGWEAVVNCHPRNNDEAADATSIIIGPSGSGCQNPNLADNSYATNSYAYNRDPSCRGYRGGDVWFSFTAPASGVKLTVNYSDWSTVAYALYDSPTSTTPIICDGIIGTGDAVLNGMTAGNTYYLRLWDYMNNNQGKVEFCLEETLPNDEATGATLVSVNAPGVCDTPNIADNTNASSSTPINGNPGCGYAGKDVWFKFDAPSSGKVVMNVTSNDWNRMVYNVYDSQTSTTPLYSTCNEVNGTGSVVIDGLTPGNTYYLRLWSYFNIHNGIVNFCLQEMPAYDEAAGATQVSIIPFNSTCQNPNVADNTIATSSTPINGNPGCGYAGKDVWFKFDAPSSGSVVMNVTSNAWNRMVYNVYDSPTSTMPLYSTCNEVNGIGSVVLDGLTSGNTYYLRLWSYFNINNGIVEFCLKDMPAYDEAAGATQVSVNTSSVCNTPSVADNTIATSSTPINGNPGCGYAGKDVWFKFDAPSSGSVVMNVSSNAWNRMVYNVYDSPTSTMPLYSTCNEVNGTGSVVLNGLTSGNTYYLRLWSYFNINNGIVEFCLSDSAVKPSNDVGTDKLIDANVREVESNIFNVSSINETNISSIKVYDLSGRLIFTKDNINSTIYQVHFNGMSGNIYIFDIRMNNDTERVIRKIAKR